MKIPKLAIVAIAALGVAVGADSVRAGEFESGNSLLGKCESKTGTAKIAICAGYIEGASDMLAQIKEIYASASYCPGPQLKPKQLVQVVVEFLKGERVDLNDPASALISVALVRAFPCPTE
jgi:Rap1a immunity proteins